MNLTAAPEALKQVRQIHKEDRLILFLHGFNDDPSKEVFVNLTRSFFQRGDLQSYISSASTNYTVTNKTNRLYAIQSVDFQQIRALCTPLRNTYYDTNNKFEIPTHYLPNMMFFRVLVALFEFVKEDYR